MKKYFVILAVVVASLSSCINSIDNNVDPGTGTSGTGTSGGVSTAQQAALDDSAIQDYLKAHNITNAQKDGSGLYYVITAPGSTLHPSASSIVTVDYAGTLLATGAQFSAATKFRAALSQLIPAWTIGLPLIGEGGSITLYCPSALGYGATAYNGIPANSVLIFNISLTTVGG